MIIVLTLYFIGWLLNGAIALTAALFDLRGRGNPKIDQYRNINAMRRLYG